jgi:hypothetical protein
MHPTTRVIIGLMVLWAAVPGPLHQTVWYTVALAPGLLFVAIDILMGED